MAGFGKTNLTWLGDTILDIEYYIHKVTISLNKGLDIPDIKSLMSNLSDEEFFLIIKAGQILSNDWAELDIDEEPTKPDHKVISMPAKLKEMKWNVL